MLSSAVLSICYNYTLIETYFFKEEPDLLLPTILNPMLGILDRLNINVNNNQHNKWLASPSHSSGPGCRSDPRRSPWTTWRGWQSCCWKRWCCREGRRSDPCFPAPQLYLLEEKHILYYYGIFMKTWRKTWKCNVCLLLWLWRWDYFGHDFGANKKPEHYLTATIDNWETQQNCPNITSASHI